MADNFLFNENLSALPYILIFNKIILGQQICLENFFPYHNFFKKGSGERFIKPTTKAIEILNLHTFKKKGSEKMDTDYLL